MKTEIGGYFELENFNGIEYHSKAIRLNSGRNCLAYLIEARNIKKILLPYLVCSSIIDTCKKYNIEINYYHINNDFFPQLDRICKDEYLYIINYYGYISNIDIKNLNKLYNNIIIDNSQNFFQKPEKSVDTLYSCRKYFGVPDGAYLYTDAILEYKLQQDNSFRRMKHLLGRFEENAASHYNEFLENEYIIEKLPLKIMSKLTNNLLRSVDYNLSLKKRDRNYLFLHEHLKTINKLNIKIPEGAFSYPLLIDNGDYVRKKLQDLKVYVPILWPNVIASNNNSSIEYKYAKNILPLPCDNRYNEKELKYLIKIIKNFISK